ncbi:MAG TPA: sigma-70 family RNA polymerase sigma factor [Myxococcales bacterium]|jgi:RNA polymerase sigma-70 factor (ECF subfamily)
METDRSATIANAVVAPGKSFQSMHGSHAQRIVVIAQRVLGSHDDAEDVSQDVLLDVWRRGDDFDPERGSVSAWVSSIARHRAIDRLRQRERDKSLAEDAARDALTTTNAPGVEPNCDRGSIRRAMAALPAPLCQALELAYFEGLTHREIATRTCTPLGTVKTRLRMALARLQEALGPPAVTSEHVEDES